MDNSSLDVLNQLKKISSDVGLYNQDKEHFDKIEDSIRMYGELLPASIEKELGDLENINEVFDLLEERITKKVFTGDDIINIVNHNKKLDYLVTFSKVLDMLAENILKHSKKDTDKQILDPLSVFTILYTYRNLYGSFDTLITKENPIYEENKLISLLELAERELNASSLTSENNSAFQCFPTLLDEELTDYIVKSQISIDDFFYY